MKKACIAVIASVCMLTGCAETIDTTPDVQNKVADYAASMILKYDIRNDSSLTMMEVEKKTPEETQDVPETKQPEENNDNEQLPAGEQPEPTAQPVSEMMLIAGIPGISITYSGVEISGEYSSDSSQIYRVMAKQGKSLVILKFQLMNQGTEAVTCNFLEKDPQFTIIINGETKIPVDMTGLLDDLSTYMLDVPAGGTQTAVLIGQVEGDMQSAGAIQKIELDISINDTKAMIALQ